MPNISGIYETWNNYLEKIPPKNTDIYFSEEYLKLYGTDKKHPVCFVYSECDNYFLFPFLKEKIFETEYFDFETAYGYGGVVSTCNNFEFLTNAWKEFKITLSKNNYIAGFVRLHPVLENYKLFDESFEILDNRKTVSIDLTFTAEQIWGNEIHSKHRNVIRKAISEGLTYEVDDDYNYINEFYNMYNLTMKRINAPLFYYFKKEYYEKIKKIMKENSFIGLVKKNDKIIAMAIFLYSKYYGHYHLAGSLEEYLKYYPNNLLIYNTALELKKRNVTIFHLGGGVSASQDDSLYKFKKRFSKNENTFKIVKVIINKKIYSDLCRKWEQSDPVKAEKYKNIFLRYRL